MKQRVLVGGIGNIFLGDDGFGVEVAQRLLQRAWPDTVRVVGFGIRGFDLAFALMDDYDAVILVDAAPRGGTPGTLYTIEPDWKAIDDAGSEAAGLETHGMNPLKVLAMVKSMGGVPPKSLLIVGCEPEPSAAGEDIERMGLSEPVAAAVDAAAEMVESLVQQIVTQERAVSAPTASVDQPASQSIPITGL